MVSEIGNKTDEELMIFYQDGNQNAFQEIYRRHSRKVYGYLKRRIREAELVDDIFQATFLKLHTSKERFDPSLPFTPWLFTVCRSVMIDTLRKKKVQITTTHWEDLENEPEDPQALSASNSTNELPDLSELPESQQKVIELRYAEDLSFEEIALKLQTSPTNVRQLVSRGVRKLKDLMGPKGVADGK